MCYLKEAVKKRKNLQETHAHRRTYLTQNRKSVAFLTSLILPLSPSSRDVLSAAKAQWVPTGLGGVFIWHCSGPEATLYHCNVHFSTCFETSSKIIGLHFLWNRSGSNNWIWMSLTVVGITKRLPQTSSVNLRQWFLTLGFEPMTGSKNKLRTVTGWLKKFVEWNCFVFCAKSDYLSMHLKSFK